jgi:hypothetical protein
MNYAFFPGGNGLYRGVEVNEFPKIDMLLLGSDFGCLGALVEGREERELWTTDERGGPTWKGLRDLFREVGIDRERCFFTNAWPLLHLPLKNGKESNDDPPIDIWRRNELLTVRCIAFFQSTLKLIKPSMVVALGKGPTVFLGDAFPDELKEWSFKRGRSLNSIRWQRDLDELFMKRIPVEGSPVGRHLVCVAIHHPSKFTLHKENRREKYRGSGGRIKLLQEAMKEARIPRSDPK